MKSKVVENKKEIKYEFPLIAKSISDGAICLFMDTKTGVFLTKGNMPLSSEIGDYSRNLYPCYNVGVWQILDSVTITFESCERQ